MKLLVTRFPLESAYGGAEVQTLSLLRGLLERGHAAAFLGSCQTLLEQCSEEGILSAELEIGPPPVTARHALGFAWRRKRMQQQLTNALSEFSRVDAVLMLSLTEKLLMTERLALQGTKVVWVEHDRVGRWLTKNPWLPLLKRQSRHATIVTVSALSKKHFVGVGFDPNRIVIIPNGVDPTHLASEEPLKRLDDGRLRVGCVARLSADKGIDLLIESVRDLPQVRLDIIGGGRDEGYLRTLIGEIRRAEIDDRITIRPQAEGGIGAFYRSIDVLVLPSRDEDPFGMAAAEAMSVGVPTIVTSVCGIADWLHTGEDAIVVKPQSSQALQKAILQLQDAAARRRIGTAGMRTADRLFSLAGMIDAYEQVLTA